MGQEMTRKIRGFLSLLFIGCAGMQGAWAQESEDALQLKALYIGEEWAGVDGGLKRGTNTVHNVDLSASLDAEKFFGWTGASFLAEGFYNNGHSPNTLTGSAQQISPEDTGGVALFRLYQLWYNQDMDGGRTSVRIGLYDLNSEFDTLNSAQMFLNNGYGWNTAFDQTGLNGPSTFPNTSLGVRLRQKIGMDDKWSVQFAALDGVPGDPGHPRANTVHFSRKNGFLLIGEGDYQPGDDTKILLGYWRYTAKFDDLTVKDANGDPRQDSGNQGVYAGVHQRLYGITQKRGLDGFIRAGLSNADINRFDSSFAAGLNFTGPVAGREEDRLGFAVNVAHNGSPYMQAQRDAGMPPLRYEMNYELTYRAKINDNLTIQPDVQYIVNPGTNPGLRNAAVIGVHFEISLGNGN